MSPRKQLLDRTGDMHMNYIDKTQIQAGQNLNTEKGKWAQSSTPTQQVAGRGRISFLQWSFTESLFSRGVSCPGVVSEPTQKMHIYGLVFLSFVWIFCCWARAWSWLGSEMGRFWGSWERKKSRIEIYGIKIFYFIIFYLYLLNNYYIVTLYILMPCYWECKSWVVNL